MNLSEHILHLAEAQIVTDEVDWRKVADRINHWSSYASGEGFDATEQKEKIKDIAKSLIYTQMYKNDVLASLESIRDWELNNELSQLPLNQQISKCLKFLSALINKNQLGD